MRPSNSGKWLLVASLLLAMVAIGSSKSLSQPEEDDSDNNSDDNSDNDSDIDWTNHTPTDDEILEMMEWIKQQLEQLKSLIAFNKENLHRRLENNELASDLVAKIAEVDSYFENLQKSVAEDYDYVENILDEFNSKSVRQLSPEEEKRLEKTLDLINTFNLDSLRSMLKIAAEVFSGGAVPVTEISEDQRVLSNSTLRVLINNE